MARREPFPLDDLLGRVEATRRQARELGDGLSADQMAWAPPEGGWSVGQCFEHLIVVADQYDPKLTPLLERARAGLASPSLLGHKRTLFGRLLIDAVKPANPRRIRTARVFTPGPEPRERVVAEFCERHARVGTWLESARGIDLCAWKVTSPATRLIRYNIGDALLILVYHAERHLNQAIRVTEHPEFPRD